MTVWALTTTLRTLTLGHTHPFSFTSFIPGNASPGDAPRERLHERTANGYLWRDNHQQPDVNYIQVLEKVDFPCKVNAQHLPFKGNQLSAQTG